MGKFLIHIAQDNGHNITEKITTEYPNGLHYKISDDWWAIRSDKLSSQIAIDFGFIKDSESDTAELTEAVGFVARVDTMTGLFNRDLWEWDNNE